MTRAELEQYIKERIYPNNAQEITGEALQSVLLEINANKQDQEEGKGLSSNDFTNADKELVQTISDKVDNTEFDEFKNEYNEAIANKADFDGYYPDMTVGKADNLVGRGDTQDATINFRPSGGVPDVGNGMNITDGTARIKAIKGNSVVWNNIAGNRTVVSATIQKFNNNAEIIAGHKYLLYRTNTEDSLLVVQSVDGVEKYDFILREGVSYIIKTASYTTVAPNIHFYNPSTIKGDALMVDLTQMFSVGNEPTSYEEYLQRKPINISNEFAYNEGDLLDMKVDELVSVGDNAYNPIERKARVIGGQKYHITDSANTEDLSVSFYAFNEDDEEEREIGPIVENGKKYYIFPANGYCIVNNQVGSVCVCLEHSYEKPIKPYEVNVKDLSFIKEIATKQGELLFPNGMRSAGSVYDEIRYNVTTKKWEAVKRMDKVVIDNYTNIVKETAHQNAFTVKYQDLGISSTAKTYGSGAKLNNYSLPNSWVVNMKGVYFTTSQILVINLGEESGITTVEQFKQKLSSLPFEMVFEIKPIEVEIPNSENWNLDYLVWDFGTEEALVRDSNIDNLIPSAPFRADINYEPNAVDDLRWAIKYIRALEQRVLALEQEAEQEA